jgi:hypothetical protein
VIKKAVWVATLFAAIKFSRNSWQAFEHPNVLFGHIAEHLRVRFCRPFSKHFRFNFIFYLLVLVNIIAA